MEYINKQQILEKAKKHQNNPFGASLIIAEIEKADGVEVKQGEWEHSKRGLNLDGDYECSICHSPDGIKHFYGLKKYSYCPNCGARMDGDINDL